jgi:hypothetical protein
MSQLVQCPNPACNKKYNLKGSIPAVFTCTKCGQAMDLSAFGGAPAAPAAPAKRSAAAPSRAEAKSGPRSRRDRDDDADEGGRARYEAKPSGHAALIWGSVGAVVIAVALFLFLRDGDKPAPPPTPPPAATPPADPTSVFASPTDPAAPGTGLEPLPGAAVGTPASPVPAVVPGVAPPATGPKPGPAPATGPKPAEPSRTPSGNTTIKTWPYPDDVTAEEKERIERALETALNDTGITMREAQDTLVGMKKKAVWRLVSEFKHIQDTDTFESRRGLQRAMIVDRNLRRIDGFMERRTGYKEHINPESSPDYAVGVAKRWNAWLDSGMWKTDLAPWDPRVDESDEPRERGAPGGGK